MGLMEWSALLGNFGEFFGSVAVLATLFYLAAQIRQSVTATKAVIRMGHTHAIADYMGVGIDPKTLTSARAKQMRGEDLDDSETATVWSHNMIDFKAMEGAFDLLRMGYIDEQEWLTTENVVRQKFRFDPVARMIWEDDASASQFAPEFTTKIRGLLDDRRDGSNR